MQRAQGPFRSDGLVGGPCRKTRSIFIDAHKRVEFGVPSLNLFQMGFEQFGWRKPSVANARRHLPCGKAWKFEHGVMLAETPNSLNPRLVQFSRYGLYR